MNVAPTLTVPMLTIRCFAERNGNQWQAFSLEFGLAAQDDNFAKVKVKLEAMILSYLEDALVGEDKEHAYELLRRRAPWGAYLKYYWFNALSGLTTLSERILYREPLQLQPKLCAP